MSPNPLPAGQFTLLHAGYTRLGLAARDSTRILASDPRQRGDPMAWRWVGGQAYCGELYVGDAQTHAAYRFKPALIGDLTEIGKQILFAQQPDDQLLDRLLATLPVPRSAQLRWQKMNTLEIRVICDTGLPAAARPPRHTRPRGDWILPA
ncbi:hypothetical protein CKO28_00170 [Rhodovibrio sodomensis]|uniref:Uncharacterized protein n=1 Tax=Rhodovibrio sodomensis TaxID=1088 RepID=A0ABS1D8W0_9PROT|nr:hypothetical protein [Rhodovibrio sodomensis]MBK1666454.1 hypothetical protein [Rhodovibrio sodomensis]